MAGPILLFVGGYEGKILTLELDPTASPPTLAVRHTLKDGNAPTSLHLSADGKFLYALDEWGKPGCVRAYKVSKDGGLELTSTSSTGGMWPCHATIATSTPPTLYIANYGSSTMCSIPILPSGHLEITGANPEAHPEVINYKDEHHGPHPTRQDKSHPHGAHLDPSGKFLVVPDLGTDLLYILSISNEDGTLTPHGDQSLQPGDGPRHALFSPSSDSSQNLLYVLNELSNSISIFSYEYSRTPSLTFTPLQQNVSLLPPSPLPHKTQFSEWHAAELIIPPPYTHLYATNRAENHDPLKNNPEGPADVLAILPLRPDGLVDIEKGVSFGTCGGRGARHLSSSSESLGGKLDSKWIATACHDSNEVVVFEKDGTEGALKEVVRIKGVGKPAIVVWA